MRSREAKVELSQRDATRLLFGLVCFCFSSEWSIICQILASHQEATLPHFAGQIGPPSSSRDWLPAGQEEVHVASQLAPLWHEFPLSETPQLELEQEQAPQNAHYELLDGAQSKAEVAASEAQLPASTPLPVAATSSAPSVPQSSLAAGGSEQQQQQQQQVAALSESLVSGLTNSILKSLQSQLAEQQALGAGGLQGQELRRRRRPQQQQPVVVGQQQGGLEGSLQLDPSQGLLSGLLELSGFGGRPQGGNGSSFGPLLLATIKAVPLKWGGLVWKLAHLLAWKKVLRTHHPRAAEIQLEQEVATHEKEHERLPRAHRSPNLSSPRDKLGAGWPPGWSQAALRGAPFPVGEHMAVAGSAPHELHLAGEQNSLQAAHTWHVLRAIDTLQSAHTASQQSNVEAAAAATAAAAMLHSAPSLLDQQQPDGLLERAAAHWPNGSAPAEQAQSAAVEQTQSAAQPDPWAHFHARSNFELQQSSADGAALPSAWPPERRDNPPKWPDSKPQQAHETQFDDEPEEWR